MRFPAALVSAVLPPCEHALRPLCLPVCQHPGAACHRISQFDVVEEGNPPKDDRHQHDSDRSGSTIANSYKAAPSSRPGGRLVRRTLRNDRRKPRSGRSFHRNRNRAFLTIRAASCVAFSMKNCKPWITSRTSRKARPQTAASFDSCRGDRINTIRVRTIHGDRAARVRDGTVLPCAIEQRLIPRRGKYMLHG